jgi:hypothetical protein
MIITKASILPIICVITVHNGENFITRIPFRIIFIREIPPLNHMALGIRKTILPGHGAMHYL